MVRQIIKNAAKPLRPRVEVYAKTEDGKIIAGKYPDGGVGVFGGGIDKGESPESAAKREFREEGGFTIKNVEKIVVEYKHDSKSLGFFINKFLNKFLPFNKKMKKVIKPITQQKLPNSFTLHYYL